MIKMESEYAAQTLVIGSGAASAEDIDAEDIDSVMKNGYALRLAAEGPLKKADLAGLPLVASVAEYLYPDLDASQAPEDLAAMIREGKSGAKDGRGFFRLHAGTQRRR